jgi:hypothetical protein
MDKREWRRINKKRKRNEKKKGNIRKIKNKKE